MKLKLNNQSTLQCITALLCAFLSHYAHAQVKGTVFKDFNFNATKDVSTTFSEPGIAGITVTATDASGGTATTTTAADGSYSFPNSGVTASGKPVRLEFSALPAFTNSGVSGGTSVQFVTAGSAAINLNFGVSYPNDYCQTNPMMITPCYVETGDPNQDIVIKFSYNNVGVLPLDETSITKSGMAGSVWGMAYSRNKKLAFTSAVLKAHIPLGPAGLDAIYTTDPFSGTANATPWVQLTDDLGIAVSSTSASPQYFDNATRSVNVSPQNDANAFVDVGKVGLGDIELSADEKTLYVVNLYDKKLYAISTDTKLLVGSYAIPNPGCTNGVARPWAVGESDGKIFVGVTCDGSASGNPASLADTSGAKNLSATVYRLDGSAFTQVLHFPLNYPREPPFQYSTGCDAINRWKPWTDVVPATCADGNVGYPTPILSDIEFDDNGNMILGFTDRTGYQFGFENYGLSGTTLYSMYAGGDILRACKTSTGWNIESMTNSCSSAGGLAINTNDPNGYIVPWGFLAKPGEFYEGDFFHGDGDINGSLSYFPGHPEITLGGLAVVPNTGEVMSVSFDPVTGSPNYNTGGVITLNNTTGKRPRNGYQLYNTAPGGVTQGKGVGFGDLEALCNPAPIEIGNRVWKDTNFNGIQDPNEAALAGITVTLCLASAPSTPVATATTDSNGNYYFSSAAGTSTSSAKYGLNLLYNSDYILKFPTTATGGFSLTSNPNAGTNDMIDSDANAAGTIAFTTGLAGQNNHTFDVGYIACIKPSAIIITTTAPTFSPSGVANNDGTITLNSATNTDKCAISTLNASSYDGALYATATAYIANKVVKSAVPNTGGTYIVTLFNGNDNCYKDTTITILPVSYTPSCPKPNAGADMAICLPKTTVDLVDAPPTYQWISDPLNLNSSAITATTGIVSGLTAVGTYRYILQNISDITCADTLQITVTNGDAPIVLCNDGVASYTLTAPSTLTNVIWYNMAGVQVGTGFTLVVNSNLAGLSDGSEAYYYESTGGTGCDVNLCCPVKFVTQTCCPTPNCGGIVVLKN